MGGGQGSYNMQDNHSKQYLIRNGQVRWLKLIILATQKIEIGRMEVKASLGKKFSRPISTNGLEWW
jgi:hypothetical protein